MGKNDISRPIVHRSLKESTCDYRLNDINVTVGTIPNRHIFFGPSPILANIPGYNRGTRVKNGRKFETFPAD